MLGKPPIGGLTGASMVKKLMTNKVKDGILEAFEKAGGVDYLVELARCDPPTFCMLLAKVIPSEIKADITNSHTINLGEAMLQAENRIGRLEYDKSTDQFVPDTKQLRSAAVL
jgi:hypothetical protein